MSLAYACLNCPRRSFCELDRPEGLQEETPPKATPRMKRQNRCGTCEASAGAAETARAAWTALPEATYQETS